MIMQNGWQNPVAFTVTKPLAQNTICVSNRFQALMGEGIDPPSTDCGVTGDSENESVDKCN